MLSRRSARAEQHGIQHGGRGRFETSSVRHTIEIGE
jgi:hypothetical protein